MKNKKVASYVKKNIMIFVIGIILFCGIGVYASVTFASSTVTYSNASSGLNSTNVQEAIDELYNSCNNSSTSSSGPANDLLDMVDVVETGNGLYKDEYEDGRYFYRGANPNNYITFNGEKAGWRIISVEGDGTIKITKTASVGTYMYDYNNHDWFSPATLNINLNQTYYDGLTATAKSQIGSHRWGAGEINTNDDLETQINKENGTRWYGKIALPTVSEYLRANSNQSQCNSYTLYNNNLSTCKKTNWMFLNNSEWFTFTQSDRDYVIVLSRTGSLAIADADEYNIIYHATLYLSSEVKIAGGTGTQADPFTIQ